MIEINGYFAFWLFATLFVGFLSIAIIIAKLLGPSKPNPIKDKIYECGQEPFGNASDFKITGMTRYFGYAVVFFALDAFSWVILMAALSPGVNPTSVYNIAIYALIVLVGIGYFLAELRKTVR